MKNSGSKPPTAQLYASLINLPTKELHAPNHTLRNIHWSSYVISNKQENAERLAKCWASWGMHQFRRKDLSYGQRVCAHRLPTSSWAPHMGMDQVTYEMPILCGNEHPKIPTILGYHSGFWLIAICLLD
jgi:hypothetical protein